MGKKGVSLLLFLMVFSSGCVSKPPKNKSDLCAIFGEKRSWYKDAVRSEKRWNIPLTTSMAIMYQESSFNAKAKPPRRRLLGFIPWKRQSSAYGYAQALDGTWKHYKEQSGNWSADRDDFGDAIDFVAWYSRDAVKHTKVNPANAYGLYLVYHEGVGGYRRGSYQNKPQVKKTASKVQARAKRYHRQYAGCKKRLDRPWWRFW